MIVTRDQDISSKQQFGHHLEPSNGQQQLNEDDTKQETVAGNQKDRSQKQKPATKRQLQQAKDPGAWLTNEGVPSGGKRCAAEVSSRPQGKAGRTRGFRTDLSWLLR